VTLKRPDALAALGAGAGKHALLRRELPHLDSLVQTAGHKLVAIWAKCNRVDGILVSLCAFQPLDQIP
jgi:hypothetical protein